MAAPAYGGPGWLWDCGYGGPWLCRAVTIVYRFKVIVILVFEQHYIIAKIGSCLHIGSVNG